MDVLDAAAPVGVRFDTQPALEVGAAHLTSADVYVLDSPRDLASDGDSTMTVLHTTVLDDDVFAGNVNAATVFVSSRFNRNAVIAGTENAAGNQDIAAGLRVAPVVVGPVTVNIDISHGDVFTEHRIQLPHGRVPHCEAFQQNIFAAVGLDEVRP